MNGLLLFTSDNYAENHVFAIDYQLCHIVESSRPVHLNLGDVMKKKNGKNEKKKRIRKDSEYPTYFPEACSHDCPGYVNILDTAEWR